MDAFGLSLQGLAPHLPELALAGGLAWGAGLRVYLVVFALGLAGRHGYVELPSHLAVLSSPLVIAAAGFMALVELFADKVPFLDTVWDALQTFIRIPAGAALAAGVFGDAGAGVALAAALLGGSLTAATHFSKAGTRAVVNTSPEPFSNVAVSAGEDALVLAGTWLAIAYPVLFLVLLGLFLAGAVLLVSVLVRGFRRMFGTRSEPPPAPPAA
jgi:hypothetical protein